MQNIDFSLFSYRASFMGSPVGCGCSEIIALSIPMGAVVGPYCLFDLNCHFDCLLFPNSWSHNFHPDLPVLQLWRTERRTCRGGRRGWKGNRSGYRSVVNIDRTPCNFIVDNAFFPYSFRYYHSKAVFHITVCRSVGFYVRSIHFLSYKTLGPSNNVCWSNSYHVPKGTVGTLWVTKESLIETLRFEKW